MRASKLVQARAQEGAAFSLQNYRTVSPHLLRLLGGPTPKKELCH